MQVDFLRGEAAGCDFLLHGIRNFDLAATFECGQCFRWEKVCEDTYEGIAFRKRLRISLSGDTLRLHRTTEDDFSHIWQGYFDLDRNYGALKDLFRKDAVLKKAVDFAPGIRVLRQDGWETLCSFILSQNNNITRIRGLVKKLCELFGDALPCGGYAFPAPEVLAGKSADDLAAVRCGFRAKYIIDAAKKVAGGEVALDSLYLLPLDDARASLQRIHGVGPKVADCTLLFGFGRIECFPVDVWISRVIKQWFPDGFPEEMMPAAGIAQQYLFHYARVQGMDQPGTAP